MSEAALWLNCGLAAAIAFMLTYLRRWRIAPAIFAGAAATLATFLIVAVARGVSLDDPLLEAELVINASFGVIFAGIGAAAGSAMKQRH